MLAYHAYIFSKRFNLDVTKVSCKSSQQLYHSYDAARLQKPGGVLYLDFSNIISYRVHACSSSNLRKWLHNGSSTMLDYYENETIQLLMGTNDTSYRELRVGATVREPFVYDCAFNQTLRETGECKRPGINVEMWDFLGNSCDVGRLILPNLF